jgi:hypothetical protein
MAGDAKIAAPVAVALLMKSLRELFINYRFMLTMN